MLKQFYGTDVVWVSWRKLLFGNENHCQDQVAAILKDEHTLTIKIS